MKKITFFLCALLISAMSFAQTTVTKTTSQLVTEHGWTVSAGNTIGTLATEFALDEVVTISTTGKPNCGSIWGTAPNNDYRLYQASSGNIVVTVKSGYELKSIKFTYSISNSGTLKDGSTNIPSKTALDVTGTTKTLTVGNTSTKTNGQVRITEFSVTYVATAPADAKKYTVTATVNDEKMGKVTGTGEYVENSTATIKAVANPGYEFVKWEDSSTANPRTITVTANTEVAATFQAMTPITCAEVNNLADGDALLLGEFTVVYVNDRYTYIQDATGSALLYASGLGLEAGNVVTGLAGTLSIYNGLPEIIPANKKADWTITNGTVPEPTVFAAAPAKTDVNKYVKFEDVTLSANATFTTESATNATMVVNGTNVTLRNTFKLAATLTKDKAYNIVGFVAIYNSSIQVYFLSAEEYVAPVVNHTVTVTANAEGENVVSGGGEYEEGKEVTVTASEDLEGWVFIGWTEDGEFVANDPEYTFVVKGDVELVAVYAMDLGENEVTDLVIDGDNMLLTGSIPGFPMGTMNLELALGEYDDEEGVFLLTEESKLYVGETNFTFVDGMAAVDMNTNSAMAIVVFEHNGAYYYMTVNMSKKIEATVIEIDNATVTIEERSMGFGDEVYHVLKMESTWSDGETTYPVLLETTEFDQTKESQEVAASITVGGRGDEDPWLGNAEGDVTITVADGKVTVEGLLENAYAWPAPVAFDVTISGKLPVVEPTTITYELNGGELPAVEVPTQDSLIAAFKDGYNAYFGVSVATTRVIDNFLYAGAAVNNPTCDVSLFMKDDASPWKWLGDYVLAVTNAQIEAGLLVTLKELATELMWRQSLTGFFLQQAKLDSNYKGNADFTEAGKPEAWGAAYQAAHAVVLPTEPVAEDYTLPTPIKEGYTFVGWYDNAAGEGEAMTVLPAGWAGTLYAIWKQGPTTALENIAVEGKAVKAIINGQLIIIKNGVQYNAQGQVVK